MTDVFYEAVKDVSGGIYAEIQSGHLGRYHFHRAFEIAYVFEGNTKYLVEDEVYPTYTHNIVFVHRYYRHKATFDAPMRKYVIAIPENFSHDVSSLLSSSTLPTLMTDVEFNKTVRPYFEALVNTDKNTPDIVVKGYISLIFGLLSEHYKSESIAPKNKNTSIIIDVLNYIDEHCEEPISLSDIAKEFGYNKSYFSRLFNDCVGTSLNNYINFVRLNRYEFLVQKNSGENLTDLIFKAGFKSLATFYRVKGLRKR